MRRETVLGIALLLLGVSLLGIFWQVQAYSTDVADRFVELGGDCTAGGTCLHEQAVNWLLIGAIPSILIIAAGIYLGFFFRLRADESVTHEQQLDLAMRALSEDERTVLNAVRAEEGITQATLKYRTDLSKTKLSVTLSDLEDRGLVARKDHGNTKKVFVGGTWKHEP